MKPDWITPDWPLPPDVRAICTTRSGGGSAAPFDSLNLGDHVGDAPAAVAANRSQFAQSIGAKPVFLHQVHGTDVVVLDPATPHGARADACVTDQPGLACTIMVADCLPVLLCSADGAVVAAAHAGWRGLAGRLDASGGSMGVLESVFESFSRKVRVTPSLFATKNIADEVSVWLGPCIGPQVFEVGPEVREAFCAAQHFTALAAGKFLASLPGLARQRLASLGLRQIYGNDGSDAWCTVSNPSRFFSHRRNSARLGGSGRFAAAIWKI